LLLLLLLLLPDELVEDGSTLSGLQEDQGGAVTAEQQFLEHRALQGQHQGVGLDHLYLLCSHCLEEEEEEEVKKITFFKVTNTVICLFPLSSQETYINTQRGSRTVSATRFDPVRPRI
jgi:hypothetical protein